MITLDNMYFILLEAGIATEDEIALVTAINGDNEQSYHDILFVRTGYRSFEQYLDDVYDGNGMEEYR